MFAIMPLMKTTHVANSGLPVTTGFAHPARNVGALGIEPGMTVADFGAGSGAYVLAIASRLAGSGKVYAIDVQRDLLRRINTDADKKGLTTVNVLWGDLEKPQGSKLGDASCDLVLISNLLFQLEDKMTPLKEAMRILRPRGRLAIIDWQESFGGMGPIKSHVVDKKNAHQLAIGAGFELVREFDAGAHHYGLVFRKV